MHCPRVNDQVHRNLAPDVAQTRGHFKVNGLSLAVAVWEFAALGDDEQVDVIDVCRRAVRTAAKQNDPRWVNRPQLINDLRNVVRHLCCIHTLIKSIPQY